MNQLEILSGITIAFQFLMKTGMTNTAKCFRDAESLTIFHRNFEKH